MHFPKQTISSVFFRVSGLFILKLIFSNAEKLSNGGPEAPKDLLTLLNYDKRFMRKFEMY